ncbi:ABC-type enterochelin transport system, permease component [Bartonella choladocola]|uniref:ABC-type enterochelin transport system, permease component n=2 Tax=Bartonella choladocola TaxID=2750995 RepID=A0A1U9MIX1_9HYPH|nr:ABC-type enterochelin transport system, permease component [Bartonella choladocola]
MARKIPETKNPALKGERPQPAGNDVAGTNPVKSGMATPDLLERDHIKTAIGEDNFTKTEIIETDTSAPDNQRNEIVEAEIDEKDIGEAGIGEAGLDEVKIPNKKADRDLGKEASAEAGREAGGEENEDANGDAGGKKGKKASEENAAALSGFISTDEANSSKTAITGSGSADLSFSKTGHSRKIRSTLPLLIGLGVVAAIFIALYLSWNMSVVIWPFRLGKLVSLVLIAYTIAVSTVLFQTVSNNRILTPSIMGFDQLYILIQTVVVYFVGSTVIYGVSDEVRFIVVALILTLFSTSLFTWLFSGTIKGLHMTLLIGVVFGGLFFSLRMLLQLQLNPDEAVNLTDVMFANFNRFNTNLIGIAVIIVVIVSLFGWRMRYLFDVLALGRDMAINLGVDYKQAVTRILVLVSIMVAVSTALVGPVTFFGLLVASLAYQFTPTAKHMSVLPVAILLSIIFLVGGQFILEQLFNMASRLSFIIEFVGGIVFLTLLIKGKLR